MLAAVVIVASVACGDPYLRTNPYDPAFDVTITVQGPDTIFSSFEQATYTAQTTPSFPDSAIHWTVAEARTDALQPSCRRPAALAADRNGR